MNDTLEVLDPPAAGGTLEVLVPPAASLSDTLDIMPPPGPREVETYRRRIAARETSPAERYNASYQNTAPANATRTEIQLDRNTDLHLPSIEEQQATMGPPRSRSLMERVSDAVGNYGGSAVKAAITGQSPDQAFAQYQALKNLLPGARGMSDRELYDLYFDQNGQLKEDRLKAPAPAAFGRGTRQVQGMGLGLTQWLATLAGVETPGIDAQAAYNKQQLEDNPALIPSAAALSKVGGAANALTYVVEKVAENIPSSTPGLVGGGLAGKLAVSTAGTLAGEALAKRVALAQFLGAQAGSTGEEIGSIYSDALDAGAPRNRTTAAIAGVHGAIAGPIDALGEALALGRITTGVVHSGALQKILGTADGTAFLRNGLAKLGDAALEQFLAEAPTEAIQTAIENSGKYASTLIGKNNFWSNWWAEMTSPQNLQEVGEAFAAGGVSGAGMGVGSASHSVGSEVRQGLRTSSGLRQIHEILVNQEAANPKQRPGTTLEPFIPSDRQFQHQVYTSPGTLSGQLPVIQAPDVQANVEVDMLKYRKSLAPERVQLLQSVLTGIDQDAKFDLPPAMVAQIQQAAPLALEILNHRYGAEIDAGTHESVVAPIEADFLKIQNWLEESKAPVAPRAQERFRGPTMDPEPVYPGGVVDDITRFKPLQPPTAPGQPILAQFPHGDNERIVRSSTPRQLAGPAPMLALPAPEAQPAPQDAQPAEAGSPPRASVAPTAVLQPPPAQNAPTGQTVPTQFSPALARTRPPVAIPAGDGPKAPIPLSLTPKLRRAVVEGTVDEVTRLAQAGSEFLNTNDDYARAAVEYQNTEEFQNAVSKTLANMDNVPDGSVVYLEKRLLERLYGFIGEKKDQAFVGEGADAELNTGKGGFKLSAAMEFNRKDNLKRAAAEHGSIDTGGVSASGRPNSEMLAAPKQNPNAEKVDPLKIRDHIMMLFRDEHGMLDPNLETGVDYALQQIVSSILGEGDVNKAKGAKYKQWVTPGTPEYKSVLKAMADTIETLTKGGAISPEEVTGSILSRYLFGKGDGITIPVAQAALVKRFGAKAASIIVTNRPDWVNSHGEPVKGLFASDGTTGRIILNVANLQDENDAVNTVLHEALHQVWGQPDVAPAVQRLMAAERKSGPIAGYNPDETPEEWAVRAVVNRNTSREAQSRFVQLVEILWNAVKKLLGFAPSLNSLRDELAAHAIQSLGTDPTAPRGTVVRYSVASNKARAQQIFRGPEDLTKATAGLNPHQTLLVTGVAEATRMLVEKVAIQQIQWANTVVDPTAPAAVRSDQRATRAAGRILSWVAQLHNLTANSTFFGALLPESMDTAARALYGQVGMVLNRSAKAQKSLVEWQGKLAVAQNNAGNLTLAKMTMAATASIEHELVQSYTDMIDALGRLGPSITAQQIAQLNSMKQQLGAVKVKAPAAVGPALLAIAKLKPLGVDPAVWLRQEVYNGWAANGHVAMMGNEVVHFLMGYLPGQTLTGPPAGALDRAPAARLIERLAVLVQDRKAAEATVDRVKNTFLLYGASVKKNVTPLMFAKTYHDWATQHADAVEEAAQYSREFKAATEGVATQLKVIDFLQALRDSDEFKTQYQAATDRLNITSSKNPVTGEALQTYVNGGLVITSPIDGKAYSISFENSVNPYNETQKQITDLIVDIDHYLAIPNIDPTVAKAYTMVRQQLATIYQGALGAQSLTGDMAPVFLTKEWFVSLATGIPKSPLAVSTWGVNAGLHLLGQMVGNVISMDVANEGLGGISAKLLSKLMALTDNSGNNLKAAGFHPVYGRTEQIRLLRAQSKAHGMHERTVSESINRYGREVLNYIYAQGQNIGQNPVEVGDRTPQNQIITEEDLHVARIMVQYHNALINGAHADQGGAYTTNPLAIKEPNYFRKEVGYLFKMPRRLAEYAKTFIQTWTEAGTLDNKASPGSRVQRMALLNDAETFAHYVNGQMLTQNPEFYMPDRVQSQAYADRRRLGTSALFKDMTDFLDWMGQKRSELINAVPGAVPTDPIEQRVKAEESLVKEFDRQIANIAKAASTQQESDSSVQGTGAPQTSVITGNSSLTIARGSMIASDAFYSYTLVSEGDYLKFNSSLRMFYQKQQLTGITATIEAMIRDRERMEREQKAYVKSHNTQSVWRSKAQFKALQQAEVVAGDRITTIYNVDRVISLLKQQKAGLEAVMKSQLIEDASFLRTISAVESAFTISKLLSPTVQLANLISQGYLGPMILDVRRYTWTKAIVHLLATLPRNVLLIGKALYQAALASVISESKVSRMLKSNVPGWTIVGGHIWSQLAQRRAALDWLDARAGVNHPMTLKATIGDMGRRFLLSSTGGAVSEHSGSAVESLVNLLVSPWEAQARLASVVQANVDLTGLVIQKPGIEQYLDLLKVRALQVWDSRVRAQGPIALDPQHPIVPFTPAEIQEQNHRTLSFLRQQLMPAGQLEHALRDYYLRFEAERAAMLKDPTRNPQTVPLFANPGIERDVITHIMSYGNPINDSSKGEGTKGKGYPGVAKRFFYRFTSYGFKINGDLKNAMRSDVRDPTSEQLKHAAAMLGLMTALTALAVGGLVGTQWTREMYLNKVPSTPTLTALMQDGPLLGFAKAFYLGGANLFIPVMGDYFSSYITGAKSRDPTDITASVPGLGTAASVLQYAREIAQTGDLYYPTISFLKKSSQPFEALWNHTARGEAELAGINATRALRSAAPSSIETRQPMGGSVKMTPTTPDVRDALRYAVEGDKAGFDASVDRAVAKKVAAGLDPQAARKAVLSSIKARNPETSVFGRKLTDAERAQTLARMTPSQRAAVDKQMNTLANIASWVGATSSKRRGKKPKAQPGYLAGAKGPSLKVRRKHRKSKLMPAL